jgi:hypothetical protein
MADHRGEGIVEHWAEHGAGPDRPEPTWAIRATAPGGPW